MGVAVISQTIKNKQKKQNMKNLISAMMYLIILLTYLLVDKLPTLFICLAWQAGYWTEYYDNNKQSNGS